ncbi:hypothetical protein [Halovenus sp. HT40]|uniref:hypothetical protein n=1 Tax=Halovenus sp. HT40 TaxID=3126691 RepID=UPI00300EE59A
MPQRNRQPAQNQPITLPDLNTGITLLTKDDDSESALHALAVDHILLSGGTAVWIDPGTHAQTAPLTELAPSDQILSRIRVARGFTPFQHLDLLRSLPGLLTDETSLIVVPQLDQYYRDVSLYADEGKEMLLSGLASVATAARNHNVAVLVTRTSCDSFSEPIATAADHHLTCERTPFGPRFQTPDDETLAYSVDGGRWMQTTLSFWVDILATREPLYNHSIGETQDSSEVSLHGAN